MKITNQQNFSEIPSTAKFTSFPGNRAKTRCSYNNHSLDGDCVWGATNNHRGARNDPHHQLRQGGEIFHLDGCAWCLSWRPSHCPCSHPPVPLLQAVSEFEISDRHPSSCFFSRICGMCGGSGSTDFSATSTNVSMRQSGVMAEGAAFRSFKDTVEPLSTSSTKSKHYYKQTL